LQINKKYLIMGIFNLTPDSFYDGNKTNSSNYFKSQYKKVLNADIIDIGAESSRPGSESISEQEEIKRLDFFFTLPHSNKYLSIDSYKPKVIEYCLKRNFRMINDISGGGNKFINIDMAKEYNVPICLMHMKGIPKNMQKRPSYKNIIEEIKFFFSERLEYALKIGLKK